MPVPASLVLADSPQSYSFAETITVGTNFTGVCRAIYNPTAANSLTVTMSNGDSIVFSAVPIGILPIRARQVSAATTGTNIVALY
jgi:hypothetical protein